MSDLTLEMIRELSKHIPKRPCMKINPLMIIQMRKLIQKEYKDRYPIKKGD